MYQELFAENLEKLESILKQEKIIPEDEKIVGLLDGYEADFALKPLPEENSCREVLFPFSREELKKGDIIRYRPLGCPITHFAEIIEDKKLAYIYSDINDVIEFFGSEELSKYINEFKDERRELSKKFDNEKFSTSFIRILKKNN